VRSGKRQFKVICLQKAASSTSLKVKTVNVVTGRQVSGVFIQIHKSNSQQPEEGVTNKHGLIDLNIKEVCTMVLTVNKSGYASLARKIDITHGLLESA